MNIKDITDTSWGVYKIINNINGEFYIGSTIENFRKRLCKHISDFKRNKPTCPFLYNAIKKYGVDNFSFLIVRGFKRKKDSKTNKKIATYIEEKQINKQEPKYNICKKPTLSGCPNLGRKLSETWKNNIGKKSKLYSHKKDKIIYEKVKMQNKSNACIYVIYEKELKIFEGSIVDCAKYLKINITSFFNYKKENIKIEKIKSQKKKITLNIDNVNLTFDSFNKCDKYLNMWRGFTSTQIINKKEKILMYKYVLN